MPAPALAKTITIHLNEYVKAGHDFFFNEIFSFLRDRGVAGATLIRPAAGFGWHHHVHSTKGGLTEENHGVSLGGCRPSTGPAATSPSPPSVN